MSNMICPKCGGVLCWNSDAMANEISDDYADDDEAIVSNYTCKRCGREIEVLDPVRSEREGDYAEFWDNDNK